MNSWWMFLAWSGNIDRQAHLQLELGRTHIFGCISNSLTRDVFANCFILLMYADLESVYGIFTATQARCHRISRLIAEFPKRDQMYPLVHPVGPVQLQEHTLQIPDWPKEHGWVISSTQNIPLYYHFHGIPRLVAIFLPRHQPLIPPLSYGTPWQTLPLLSDDRITVCILLGGAPTVSGFL
jgi:hypothetical protein